MTHAPHKDDLIAWLDENPTITSKKDIIKAFNLKGAARLELKRLIKELQGEGLVKRAAHYDRQAGDLPPVLVVDVIALTSEGELLSIPVQWDDKDSAPQILLSAPNGAPALKVNDHALVRITPHGGDDYQYTGQVIRKIEQRSSTALGIFKTSSEGGRVIPVDKNSRQEWMIPAHLTNNAKEGELVEIEPIGKKGRLGLIKAKVLNCLGSPFCAKSVSLIAIHQHAIPDHFDDEVLEDAQNITPASLGHRVDFRDMQFVTIDPADARDHDDACFVSHDTDPKNPKGFILWVAIADIAHYVRPQSALDIEAKTRGNSTYFPDRVVPMLPDRLSGDLCSLHEHVERAAIVAEIKIDASGQKLSQMFHRALIQSHASLTYDEVQKSVDGYASERLKPMMDTVIHPLYGAYEALKKARAKRQPLELDLPERQITLSDTGEVQSIIFKERFDAHKMIEEFMVLANVAAAETLQDKRTPLLFRTHEDPHPEKLEALRDIAQSAGYKLAKGQNITPEHLNRLLKQAKGKDHDTLINLSTLRSMTQAYYDPQQAGHFGLALRSYAHFTSPIRRYADLIVHRALVTAHGWGDDGLSDIDIAQLSATAQSISQTERRSMVAERDTTDRYLAAFLSDRTGTHMTGRISGVTSFGAFIRLDDTGADALLPMRNLGREYFHFDQDAQCLIGERSRLKISLGDRVVVKLMDVTPATGGLIVDLVEVNGTSLTQRRKGGPKKGSPYKKNKSKSKPKTRVRERVKRARS